MATRLYRIGGWAFEHRSTVLVTWLVVLAGVIASASAFSGKTSNEFSVPGTESQVAQDLLEEKFPEAGGGSARVVFAAPKGEKLTDADNKAAVMESVENASKAPEVTAVQDPYSMGAISKDGRIGFADVYYPVKAEEVEKSSADALEASTEPPTKAGMQVEFGGGVVTEETESKAKMVGMSVGFLVLAMTLGSLLAAGLPLFTALIGVTLGMFGITAMSGAIEISETAPILATMLGLAVGIDYALFILSRHRHSLDDGLEPREAAAQATATAGSAVVFAGATVVIALVGLAVVQHPVPDGHGRGRGGDRVAVRGDRGDPASRHARIRRQALRASQQVPHQAAEAPRGGSPDAEHPLRQAHHAPAAGRRAAGPGPARIRSRSRLRT